MAKQSGLKVYILNRYYPPNSSVTGDSAFHLAQFLESKGIDVYSASIGAKYTDSQIKSGKSSNNLVLKSSFNGKNKILRLVFNLWEGYRLVKTAINNEPDVIITLTDPPLINLWASIYLRKKSTIRWVNWTMDLYPDAFVSARLVGESNLIYRFFKAQLQKVKPNLIIALGEIQLNYLKENYYSEIDATILPCGIHSIKKADKEPIWLESDKIIFAYAGNIGEAHSDTFLINFISTLNAEKHKLILSVYGSKSAKVIEAASAHKDAVTIVDRVDKSEFEYIDIHLVSLLPEWTNICVPSKAVSAVCANSTILFYGLENSDTRHLLKDACFFIPYSNSIEMEQNRINTFLSKLDRASIQEKQKASTSIKLELEKLQNSSYDNLRNFIKGKILD